VRARDDLRVRFGAMKLLVEAFDFRAERMGVEIADAQHHVGVHDVDDRFGAQLDAARELLRADRATQRLLPDGEKAVRNRAFA
jgi:hypothetical protein